MADVPRPVTRSRLMRMPELRRRLTTRRGSPMPAALAPDAVTVLPSDKNAIIADSWLVDDAMSLLSFLVSVFVMFLCFLVFFGEIIRTGSLPLPLRRNRTRLADHRPKLERSRRSSNRVRRMPNELFRRSEQCIERLIAHDP